MFLEMGYNAQASDIMTDPAADISKQSGFFALLGLALRLQEHGLILAGPPCSLFIFLSSSVHKRSVSNPHGDCTRADVRLSNLVVTNFIHILLVCVPRGVKFIIEQPLTSTMYSLPCFNQLGETLGWEDFATITTYMWWFGHDMVKPTKLLSNMRSTRLLARRQPPNTGERRSEYVRYTPAGAAGGRLLHRSAMYTRPFVMAVFCAWEKQWPR